MIFFCTFKGNLIKNSRLSTINDIIMLRDYGASVHMGLETGWPGNGVAAHFLSVS